MHRGALVHRVLPGASATDRRNWSRSRPTHIVTAVRAGGTIKGVLLVVGDTLTTPRGGRWNPRFDFEDIVHEFGLDYGTEEELARAIAEGDEYLNQMAAKGNRADYHRVLLHALGIEPSEELLAALDA